jgi:hypothetical protein
MDTKKELFESLVRFDRPVKELEQKIGKFGVDWFGDPLAILTRQDVISVLNRFLNEQLSAREVEDWAFSISGRMVIGYEAGYANLLQGVIETLELTADWGEPLTSEMAREMIDQLLEAKFEREE